MFDWNDLKYFLAIARHHSTLAAGRALKVNQSTVQRRLTELERRIGQQLGNALELRIVEGLHRAQLLERPRVAGRCRDRAQCP